MSTGSHWPGQITLQTLSLRSVPGVSGDAPLMANSLPHIRIRQPQAFTPALKTSTSDMCQPPVLRSKATHASRVLITKDRQLLTFRGFDNLSNFIMLGTNNHLHGIKRGCTVSHLMISHFNH